MKKKITIIIACVAALAVIGGAVALIASNAGNHSGTPEESTLPEESTNPEESTTPEESTDINIPDIDPSQTDEPDESEVNVDLSDVDPENIVSPDESETVPPETVVTPPVVTEPVTTPATETPETGTKAPEPAKPETTPTAPETQPEKQPEGIVIGGKPADEPYSCGVAGHHCEGPETHAYISNLELKGCKYCGSHSCPSFYATDKWGNACYDPTVCPQYGVTKDPLNYCSVCGKPTGDGTNGTCVHYIQECDCPNCGKHVGSRECHSCN